MRMTNGTTIIRTYRTPLAVIDTMTTQARIPSADGEETVPDREGPH